MWGKIVGGLIEIGESIGAAIGQTVDEVRKLTSNERKKSGKAKMRPTLRFSNLPGPYRINTHEIAVSIYYPNRHSNHHQGSFSEALLNWKTQPNREFSRYMVGEMKEIIRSVKWEHIDLIVAAPSSGPITYIASGLAKEIHAQAPRGYIYRTRPLKKQHDLGKVERQKNVSGAFSFSKTPSIRGKNVLIVDDVRTSGATLSEVKRVLELGGAKNIYVLVMAQTYQTPWPFQPVNLHISKDKVVHTNVINANVSGSKRPHREPSSKTDPVTSDIRRMDEIISAVKSNDVECLRSLVLKGYDVNCKSSTGNTPLAYAVQNGNLEMVQLLIGARANPNVTNKDGTSLLSYIILKRFQSIFNVVVEECNPNFTSENGVSPLMSAASKGAETCVRQLLDIGADPNHTDKEGHNALMYAVKFPSVMRMLISAGTHVNHTNQKGHSVLAFAIRTGNMNSIRIVIDAGGKVDSKCIVLAEEHLGSQDVKFLVKRHKDQNPVQVISPIDLVASQKESERRTYESTVKRSHSFEETYERRELRTNVCPSCGYPIRNGAYCRCSD